MKHFRLFSAAVISAAFIISSLFSLSGCRTVEEPAPPLVESSAPEPETVEPAEIFEEPEALDIDWGGSAWILPDSQDKSPKEFPGYRGFFLGRDGCLLLINQDRASGKLWKVDGNRMTLSILEGTPDLPLEGTFLIFPETENDEITGIRLVPELTPEAEGIKLERVKVNVDIVENHWIPKWLKGGEKVNWPMNREIHLMLLPDLSGMGVLGFGGENRFHGSIKLGKEAFIIGPLAITRRYGPASEFENLYVQRLSDANRFVQAGDDLFLYADTSPVAAFRVRLFD